MYRVLRGSLYVSSITIDYYKIRTRVFCGAARSDCAGQETRRFCSFCCAVRQPDMAGVAYPADITWNFAVTRQEVLFSSEGSGQKRHHNL